MAAPPQPVGSQRLFVALWPQDATRDAIVRVQGAWTWPRQAALVRAERLHITLHFLGDVPSAQVPALRESLRVNFEPAALMLWRCEVWGNGVAVLVPDAVPQALLRLHETLEGAIAGAGLVPESRAWRPHVTLSRRAFRAVPPRAADPIEWIASDGVVLVRTMPGNGRYEIVERFAG